MRFWGALTLVALGACASASVERPGPTESEFTAMLAQRRSVPPMIRALSCDFIEEEGSEWSCRWEERASNGVWVKQANFIAIDGNGWLPIDTFCTADEALADPRRCGGA